MKIATKFVLSASIYLFIGALMMAGMRVVEWVIPQPETKVLVCFASDAGKISQCKRLDDLIKKEGSA